jgi:hypothetical protein
LVAVFAWITELGSSAPLTLIAIVITTDFYGLSVGDF